MCKYLVVILLTFQGEVILERYGFQRPVEVHECMDIGNDHREQIASYNSKKNTWMLNDGRGTFQGFICE